jgi:hypothetical protein
MNIYMHIYIYAYIYIYIYINIHVYMWYSIAYVCITLCKNMILLEMSPIISTIVYECFTIFLFKLVIFVFVGL